MNERKINAYPIPLKDLFTLHLPEFAKVLTVHVDKNQPFLWAEFMKIHEPHIEIRTFRMQTAGQTWTAPPGKHLDYVGTFQLQDPAFIGHVYEERPGVNG